jgi:bifunctional UDP-N-acetylglucosamine pyrophosphorylase/glucosamine-1-phosphate N-acetyltransferase
MGRARAAIILAAGQGTRMKSDLPKVLHAMGGRPMLDWGMALASGMGCERTVVVTAAKAEAVQARVRAALGDAGVAVQDPPRGTGDAARAAQPNLAGFEGDVAIYFADTPLIRAETLGKMFAAREAGAAMVMLGFQAKDPTGYGRIILDANGAFLRNVEHKDANEQERRVTLCNSGALVGDAKVLFELVAQLKDDNAQKEFYLTDVPGLARAAGMKVAVVEATEAEVMGINSRAQLADAEAAFQKRARAAALDAGVTMIDPATVYFSYDTEIAPDVIIEPNVFFGPGVKIARGARIKAFSHLEGASVGESAQVGPSARLRPGTRLAAGAKIGNFVEVKNATFGENAQASHLTYVGDAEVGARANIGCGTITCNYDGYDKYKTVIGEDAFIGSDTALVAPVTVGARAMTGSGSVITKDVPDDALAVARGRQLNVDNWARRFREKKLAERAARGGKRKEVE